MKRTAVLVIATGGLAIALAIVGYLSGLELALLRMERAGVEEIIVTSPGEPAGVQLMTGLAFAWPALTAAVAIGLHRWRRGTDPSWRAVALYLAIPLVIAGGYTALQLTWISSVMGQGAAMIPLREFGPTARDAQLLGFVSLVMWLYVWVRRS